MSGQQPQQFRTTPGFGAPDSSAAPTVQTTGFQATPARVQSTGASWAAIGGALNDFFGKAAKSAESASDIMLREDMVQLERENKALPQQARVDKALGKPMDPELAERQDYYGAYQIAAADESASELSSLLKDRLGRIDLDGTTDPKAVAEQFYKDHIGKGTGDREYDDRLLSQFGRQAAVHVAEAQEGVIRTTTQNTSRTIIDGGAKVILSGDMSAGKLAVIRDQIATVSRGDRKIGDQLLFATLSSVQNDGQAVSVLKSMQELGMDKEHPEQFNRLSGLMLERTNKVKSYDAGLAVQNYQMRLAQDRSRYPGGILPPDKIPQYAQDWANIDSVHGVGLQGSGLLEMWEKGISRTVRQNLWDAAFDGKLGTQTLSRVASSQNETTSKVMGMDYDSAVSRRLVAMSPALRATVDGTGIVDPMKSDAAAKDYAAFVLNPGHRSASDDTISDTFKTTMGTPLNGKDPVAMTRSFGFYNDLLQGGMSRDQLHRYFPDSTTENHFWGMQGMSQGGRAVAQIAKDLTDNPYDQKVLDSAMVDGHVNLAKLSGLTGKPEDIDAKITAARNDAFLESAERKKWFFNADIGTDSNEGAVFDALLADQFMVQRRGGKKVDLDAAIKAVAGQTGGYLVTPTANGGLQAYKDPFGGRGRTLLQPLNADATSAVSVTKGFKPIYALGAKVTNAVGEPEDTLVTWAEDAERAAKQFPGRIAEGDKLYLERQDKNGLSMVKDPTGQMIQFMPGQKVVMPITKTREVPVDERMPLVAPGETALTLPRTGTTTVTETVNEAVEVPKDPVAATAFFRKNLGAGWEALPVGFNGPDGHGWVLHYAPRVKVGEAEKAAAMQNRGTGVMDRRLRIAVEKANRGSGLMNNLDNLPATGYAP